MGGKRILLVEDDAAIRQLVSDLLAGEGYDVTAAASGAEGLERAGHLQPDLILLDKLMPQGDGTHFATEYRKRSGGPAPIVALCAAREGPEWAASIGAAAFVVKPFDIDALLGVVREQLGERS